MLISFIVVNYNTGNILRECVESVHKFEKAGDFEIIVVDNCSTDDSIKYIDELTNQFNDVSCIFLKTKISFSAANNIGFDSSTGDYVLIMNPDIIFTESLLDKLVNDLRSNKNLGAVSPLLIGNDGQFQRAYFQRYPSLMQFILFYSILGNLFVHNKSLVNKYQENGDINVNSNSIEDTQQIPCAFFFTERSIFEKAGRMDESYVLFFEDVDLSYQIHKEQKLGVDTSLRVRHLGGASFKTSDDYWLYGRFILGMINFFSKNYGPIRTFLLKALAVINSSIIVLIEKIKNIFKKEDEYRYRKHKYFLKEFRKTYL